MDRHLVYPGQIPLDTDVLNAIKDAYVGLGWIAQTVLGTGAAVSGFAVTPTAPASLLVNVAPGAIYSLQTADSSAFGSLGLDSTQFVKQGLLKSATTLTLTPPATVGQSINYLVQVQFSEVDSSPVVLPYYNASNPSVAWNGPANSGTSQNTVRKDTAAVGLKAGSPAATGSQVTPSPDVGYTGLYVVTVANGQTAITSGNISAYAAAPTFAPLPSIPPYVQNQTWTSSVDAGTATALVVSISPAPSAYSKFMSVTVQAANAATGAATLNVNGLGAKAIVDTSGSAVTANAWQSGDILRLVYDGTSFRMVSGASVSTTPRATQQFTGSTSFTVPANVTRIHARVWGGGGGGGGSTGSGGAGSGGGGGGYAESTVAVTPGQVITITVGAGGAGGSSSPTNGGNGGASSFGSYVTASGGGGGQAGNGGLATSFGGSAGTGSGSLAVNGATGGIAFLVGTIPAAGIGGSAGMGSGSPTISIGGVGAAGLFPGGGANGGSAGTFAGAAGGPGLVVIEY